MKSYSSHERSTNGKDEWLTPRYITDALGPFDLDPCSPINRPWDTASSYFTQLDDGLVQQWNGRVWCNPPYGSQTRKWMRKLNDHGNGIALITPRTETGTFFESVWGKAHSIFFFKGRLNFHHVCGKKGGPSGAPSCLVCYGEENTNRVLDAISQGLLKGHLVRL